ncbi:MAG: hypothetical protein J7639_07740 [Paenibacillaceae bacterium]|nr:hypothetical protein [Paenibacillaceae bacterium]
MRGQVRRHLCVNSISPVVGEIGHKKWLIGFISAVSSKITSENTGYFGQTVSFRVD